MIDPAVLERHGLKRDEYDRIVAFLGREPNLTELGIFSVMWSEHCSYKSSRVHLRTLPTEGPQVLQGPGENAGAVDIGEGLAAVFKIESHNHPSFIEPYQGAATGVGGIIRDIFTMGARPIALMNSLRFGSLDARGTPRLLEGVVAGIAGYGNSIGVPTVAGEIAFEPSYAGNPLVNVFCLGIARAADIIKGVASGVGNAVYYVGAKTGRDGIHGATMASAEFDDKSAEKRPAVQVGDPFMEKLLLEACLEVMQTDALVGIQDMGAAGLTCSTTEMGSRGGAGIEIDVALVPQRETGMTPYEIMLSESQERMLLVVKRGREAEVERIFDKWDLHAVHIGEVTADGLLRVKQRGAVVAEIPNRALTDEAPVYQRPMEAPGYLADAQRLDFDSLRCPARCERRAACDCRLADCRQQAVGVPRSTTTWCRPTRSTCPVWARAWSASRGRSGPWPCRSTATGGTAISTRRRGAMLAVAEAARNVACAGARPLGATNCLNFGNPERPAIMWQFAQAVEGIGEACRALAIPITGGNVSLYNETDGKAIYPTPIIGVVGLLQHADRVLSGRFQKSGDAIILLGSGRGELGGSEYLKVVHDRVSGLPPQLDLQFERSLQELVVALADDRLIESAHDCSDGGMAMTLAECCFGADDRGADVSLDPVAIAREPRLNQAAALFGESASRVIVSASPDMVADVLARAAAKGLPAKVIGRTGGHQLRVSVGGELAIDIADRRARADLGIRRRAALHPQGCLMFDKFREECGVFGIFGHPEAANMTYLGLYALQHRGQESAGIAAADLQQVRVSRAMGYVADTFDNNDAVAPARAAGHRSRPLLDGRREQALECPADPDRLRARPDRHLPQRQPRERRRAPRRARSSGLDLPVRQRHRGRAAPVRPFEGGVGRRRDRRVGGPGSGRVFVPDADQGSAHGGPRPAWVPPAGARPPRRRVRWSVRKPARWT